MRPLLGLRLAVISAAAFGATAPAGLPASRIPAAPRPRISSVSATRLTLPAIGGQTRISASVGWATTCAWSGKWAGAATGSNTHPYACGSGGGSVMITDMLTLPPNPSASSRVWIVYLIARGPGGTSRWAHIDITEDALPSTTSTAAAAPTTTASPPTPQSPASTSANWSGYVLPSSSLFTETGGRWSVPTLDCGATPNGGASTWVGIGGEAWPTGGTSGTLLQTGVTTECDNGLQIDRGWFEELPSNPNFSEPFLGLSISPGDSIQASVYRDTNGNWETRLDDLTTGNSGLMVTGQGWGVAADTGSGSLSFHEQGSTARLSYSGGYTAEWIVEDYSRGSSINSATRVPLGAFGTVSFSNLTTSLSSWVLTPAESVGIFQNGSLVSQPSPPTSSGFSVTYSG